MGCWDDNSIKRSFCHCRAVYIPKDRKRTIDADRGVVCLYDGRAVGIGRHKTQRD